MYIFLYSLLCLNIVIYSVGVFCDDRQPYYGAIFQRSNTDIKASGYTMAPNRANSTKINNFIYGDFVCCITDINECWGAIKNATSLANIPNDKIFIKIFYGASFNAELPIQEQLRLKEVDTKLVEQFLHIQNVTPFEKSRARQRDLFWWAYENISVQYETVTNRMIIVLGENTLFISHLTSPEKTFPNNISYHVKYSSKEYTVTSNEYKCGSPSEVTYLIYQHLIEGSDNPSLIEHPCMHTNIVITFDPSNVQSKCVDNFGVNTPVTFVGDFNESKCHNLIHKVLIKEVVITKNERRVNFAGMKLPFLTKSNNKLKLKTKLFGEENIKKLKIKEFLRETKKNACDRPLKKLRSVFNGPLKKLRSIFLIENKCFQALYLEELLLNIVGISDDNVLFQNNFRWICAFKLNIFSDPRFGLTFTYETKPTFPVSTSIISPSRKPIEIFNVALLNVAINLAVALVMLIGLFLYIYFTENALK